MLQRWVSADPLGVHDDGDPHLREDPRTGNVHESPLTSNLYAYVDGSVLKATDPDGLFKQQIAQLARYIARSPAGKRVARSAARASRTVARKGKQLLSKGKQAAKRGLEKAQRAGERIARKASDKAHKIKHDAARAWRNVRAPKGLLESQKRHIDKSDNIIRDHATPGDFRGVLKEGAGGVIRGKGDKVYNHIGEMRQSVKDLTRHVKALRGSLKDPKHSEQVRRFTEGAIHRAEQTLNQMKSTLRAAARAAESRATAPPQQ